MSTRINLQGSDIDILVLRGKDIMDDEATLQVLCHGQLVTADPHGYTVELRPPVVDLDFASAPLTNLQRGMLVA